MNGWRFALSRRWLGYLALTVAFATACALLGMWQWSRNQERQAAIELVEQNYDARPVPLTEALDSLGAFDAGQEWTPVQLTGTYVTEAQMLVRNRPFGGRPGFEVLVPLELADGTVFVIDRGWLPTGSTQDAPDTVPAPPRGEVTVVARLKPGEPAIPGRSAPEGQIATIQLDRIDELVEAPVYTGAYGLLASEQPAPESAPIPAPRPEPDLGPHLSYTFQWFIFGVLAFVGLVWAVRQERRHRADPDARARDEQARRHSRSADADEEDAILDRALELETEASAVAGRPGSHGGARNGSSGSERGTDSGGTDSGGTESGGTASGDTRASADSRPGTR